MLQGLAVRQWLKHGLRRAVESALPGEASRHDEQQTKRTTHTHTHVRDVVCENDRRARARGREASR